MTCFAHLMVFMSEYQSNLTLAHTRLTPSISRKDRESDL